LISRTAQEMQDELSLYTLAHRSPAFIHQHAVDTFAAQTASERTKPIALAFAASRQQVIDLVREELG
jgi:hypothetical protein